MWKEAEILWTELLSETPYEPFPYIELAKFYEHIQKEIDKAQEMVDMLKHELGEDWKCCGYDDITRRQTRLRKKADRGLDNT
jgi:hypothetical protein